MCLRIDRQEGVEQPAKDWNQQHDRPGASLPRRNFPLAPPKPNDQHQTDTLKKGNSDNLRLAHGAGEIINDVCERRGPAATEQRIVNGLNGWSPSAPLGLGNLDIVTPSSAQGFP